MGRKRICVGCSHFFCGGSVSAINNVSSYKDAWLKRTKASSRSGEDTSNTRGASPSVDHPFPIYLQRNTNNANIFYEAPSCFAALSQSKCPCCSSKKDGGVGEWVSVCPVWRANPLTSSRHHRPPSKTRKH